MDWQMFWAATTAASTLATAISTSIVLLLRRIQRPEPDWAVDVRTRSAPDGDGDRVSLLARLQNAGDGQAFRVTVKGVGCDPALRERSESTPGSPPNDIVPYVPVMEPGSLVGLAVTSTSDAWEDAVVVVEWTRRPTRLRRRMAIDIPLTDISELPRAKG